MPSPDRYPDWSRLAKTTIREREKKVSFYVKNQKGKLVPWFSSMIGWYWMFPGPQWQVPCKWQPKNGRKYRPSILENLWSAKVWRFLQVFLTFAWFNLGESDRFRLKRFLALGNGWRFSAHDLSIWSIVKSHIVLDKQWEFFHIFFLQETYVYIYILRFTAYNLIYYIWNLELSPRSANLFCCFCGRKSWESPSSLIS